MQNTNQLKKNILEALSVIIDPDLGQDIVSLNFIKDLTVTESGDVTFKIELTTPACPVKDIFKQQALDLVSNLEGVSSVDIEMTAQTQQNTLNTDVESLKHVKNIIGVSSCKGGVGKSTVSVNLAYALSKLGAKVGLFDADVYGPSLPIMVQFPFEGLEVTEENTIIPPVHESVKLMSFGYTHPEEDTPAIMRGPMVSQVIQQLIAQTEWGELDYLIIDMPPGTGDIQLTLGQLLPMTAAVVVSTPQHVSFVDVIKGIEMFDTLNIPTIAAVENMSAFICDSCDKEHHIFGTGVKQRLEKEFGFPYVASLPLHADIAQLSDLGKPVTLTHPSHPIAKAFKQLAGAVARETSKLKHGQIKPPLVGYNEQSGILLDYPDGTQVNITPKELRAKCSCAHCVEEFTGKQLLNTSKISDNLHPLSINPVGNYALGINWSDGHSSLYPYEQLIQVLA